MTETGKILLVEDSAQDVELTLGALSQHNLANEVVVVRDGEQALDYLYTRGAFAERSAGNPVVILLDIKLPKVDGLEVLQRLRSDPGLKHTPVVMLTSSREERDIVRSYNLGVNAYVVKPVEFQSFVDAIKELGLFWAVLNQPPPPSSRHTS
jgi:CheY-like chemotaxis protein